jgi:hypothetical protein
MPPAELLRMIRQRPIIPFRMHLADGRALEVRHHDFCMVGVGTAAVGLPDQTNSELYASIEIVALPQIVGLEPIQPAKAG